MKVKYLVTLITIFLLSATVFANINNEITVTREDILHRLKKIKPMKLHITGFSQKLEFIYNDKTYNIVEIGKILVNTNTAIADLYRSALKNWNKMLKTMWNLSLRMSYGKISYQYAKLAVKNFNKLILKAKKNIDIIKLNEFGFIVREIKKEKRKKFFKERQQRILEAPQETHTPVFLGLSGSAGYAGGNYISVIGNGSLHLEFMNLQYRREFNFSFAINIGYCNISDSDKPVKPESISQKYLRLDALLFASLLTYNHSIYLGVGPVMCLRLSSNDYVDQYDYKKFLYGLTLEIGYKHITADLNLGFFIGISITHLSKRNDFYGSGSTFLGVKAGFLFNLN